MSTISANNFIATVGITTPSLAVSTINATTVNATTVNMTQWGLSILKPVSNTLQIGDIFTQSLTLVASTITVSAQNTYFLGNVINVSTTNLNVTDNNINLNVSDSLGATVLSSGLTIMSGSNAFRTFQLNNNYDFELSGLSVQNTLYANALSTNTANISQLLVTTVSATNGIFNNISSQTLNVSTANISTLNLSQLNATNASIALLSCTSGFITNITTTNLSAATVTGVQNLNLSILSVQSLNVNNGGIKNDVTNNRIGINVGATNPAVPLDVVGTTRIHTLSNNAYFDITPDVNNNGLATMLRFYTSPGGTLMDSSRIYFQNGNPSQAYSGDIYTRCAAYSTDVYTTQSNNDSSVAGLQGFTGARPIQYFQIMNTADTTRISATAFGLYMPYVSLSNLSHNIYPNVVGFGFVNGAVDPDFPLTVHCGSGTTGSGGDNYSGGIQVTDQNSYTAYVSRLPLSESFRCNGRAFFNKRITAAGTVYAGCTTSGGAGNESVITGTEIDSTSNTAIIQLHCVSNATAAAQWDCRIRALSGSAGTNATGTLELTATTVSFIAQTVQLSYVTINEMSNSVGYINNLSVGNYMSVNGMYCNNNLIISGYVDMGQTANQSRERFAISAREFTTFIGEPVLSTYTSGTLMTWGVIGYYPVKGISTNTCTYTLSTDLTTYYIRAGGLYEIDINLRETAGSTIVRGVQLEVSNDNVTWRTAYESRSGYTNNATIQNWFTHVFKFLLDSNMESAKYFRFRYLGSALGFGVNSALTPNGYCTRIMIKQIC